MAINERLIHTASDATAGSGNQEEGLILHIDANDVDSYDGTGTVWYDISDHEFKPSINPEEQFNTVLYTGDDSNDRPITGVGFQPDLVWIKNRDGAYSHMLYDSVRGAEGSGGDHLSTDTNGAAGAAVTSLFDSFDTDGFTIDKASSSRVNENGDKYVAWCFKGGGAPSGSDKVSIDGTSYATMTAAGLTDGTESITKLSVNTDLGFSIATYTAPALTGDTVAHGLGQPPEMIILKTTSAARNWNVYHKDVGTSKNLHLNENHEANTSEYWTANATTFSIQDQSASEDRVAYCFASKRGVSKVGSYTGTGSSGNKVYTGFEPAWVMMKETNTSGRSWLIVDNKRKESNGNVSELFADTTTAESGTGYDIDFNRDGFTLNTTTTNANASGGKYIYLAFAKNTNETELATTTSGVWSGFQSAVSSITSDSTSTTSAPGINESSTTSSMFNQTNYWSMGNNGTSEASNEIFITLNAAKSIKGYAVYEMFQSGYRYTGTTKLYGSTDNSNWYLLGSTVQTTSVQYNRNETTFAATPEYQYYKLTMSANNRGTYQGAWQLEFISDVDITPNLHLDAASYSGSGSTWTADAGNDATITGATYNDELGNYFDFDGNDSITSAGNLSVPNENFTVEFWTRPDSTSTSQNFFEIEDTSGNRRVSMVVNTGSTFRCYIYEASGFNNSAFPTSTTTFDTGKWYHVVVTFEKGVAAKMYINGELNVTSTTNISAARPTTYGETNIGTGAFGSLTGAIGQFRFYNTVLSAEAIRQNFNYTKPSYPNGINGTLVGPSWNASGYFDFNGTSDHVTFNYSKWHNNFSVSFWVYFDDLTFGKLFDKTTWYASSHQAFPFSIAASNGTVTASISYGNDYTFDVNVSGSYTTGKWYHILVTAEHGDKLKIWSTAEDGSFNSTPSGEAAYTGTVNGSGNNNYTIGRASAIYGGGVGQDSFLDGRISKLKMFDKVLSESERSAQFNEGA